MQTTRHFNVKVFQAFKEVFPTWQLNMLETHYLLLEVNKYQVLESCPECIPAPVKWNRCIISKQMFINFINYFKENLS